MPDKLLLPRKRPNLKRAGRFEGRPVLAWLGPRDYLFFANQGFRYTRHNGEIFEPGEMHTDGGSIPRLVWSLPDLDPWTYLPAYLLHDWLYTQRSRGEGLHSFADVSLILGEALWTLMASGAAPMNKLALWAIYRAVSGRRGQAAWEAAGDSK